MLIIYGALQADGRPAGSAMSVREHIKTAGACVAVVANNNAPESCIEALRAPKDWPANIVMVIDRKSECFASFFGRLFTLMLSGKTMPMAWVELAPQVPGLDHADAPSTIFAAEAGHVAFGDCRTDR
ncbi:MAG: hypothetical protein ABI411_05110 [Tahibacter sp.]